jgi:hypothetical protein
MRELYWEIFITPGEEKRERQTEGHVYPKRGWRKRSPNAPILESELQVLKWHYRSGTFSASAHPERQLWGVFHLHQGYRKV